MDLIKAQLIESVLAGGGEMGARMRALDWSSTVLGPLAQWPQSLRACVRVMLGSGYPMLVCWGPAYTMLYNDPYRPLIGTKHPAALGCAIRDVLPETWDFLGPRYDRVMTDGQEASHLTGQMFGDAAEIRTKRVRKQKTDRQDAQLLLRLMMEDRFPRIWVPDAANRDPRQLLWHRHRLVQMRTRVMNQLHVVALNEGLRRKKALWRPAGHKELESIRLAPWATRRRQDLLDLLDQLTPKIQELTRALEEEVEKRPVTRRLMTHPGVGPLTALAFELVVGTPERFHCGKQIASYVGLVPTEESSGDRRRLGHISKQGNVLLRFLLVEAAQVTVRSQPEWRNRFFHLAMRRGRKVAKVAMARKLAVHLYWMWRQSRAYGQWPKLGSHAGEPGHPDGVQ
ncbi:MAG: IS110 family transposase [Candidatus Sulfotelmatobacter sp.]